ncbi:hypothetical protein [Mesobacillus stamsii]|uniref:Uncharacterized protein n=1 Tax=Mesobacillus stamsii TaxID=225347 RepID=A0ABU0FX46_9BACI|nr:hypothetical protein [Mesobacillus stamsii]MDQ0414405.1 hypothetical protein [Mesobacillus stamsii]
MSKNYQALVPGRIFIGGADAIPELLENCLKRIDQVSKKSPGTMPGLPPIHHKFGFTTMNQSVDIKRMR